MRRVLALIAVLVLAPGLVRAEQVARMEPGHAAVRHAAWAAAESCRDRWSAGPSVSMRITADRHGRVRAVVTDPDAPAFARCVRDRLRAQRFAVAGREAHGEPWDVLSRYVFAAR